MTISFNVCGIAGGDVHNNRNSQLSSSHSITELFTRFCCWTLIRLSRHWAWLRWRYWRYRSLIDWLIWFHSKQTKTIRWGWRLWECTSSRVSCHDEIHFVVKLTVCVEFFRLQSSVIINSKQWLATTVWQTINSASKVWPSYRSPDGWEINTIEVNEMKIQKCKM